MSNNIYYFLNPSLQLNDMCVQEKITSLVKQHVPDAKLSAESEGKLVYTLPIETQFSVVGHYCKVISAIFPSPKGQFSIEWLTINFFPINQLKKKQTNNQLNLLLVDRRIGCLYGASSLETSLPH